MMLLAEIALVFIAKMNTYLPWVKKISLPQELDRKCWKISQAMKGGMTVKPLEK